MPLTQKCSNCGTINYILTYKKTHCSECAKKTLKKDKWKKKGSNLPT